MVDVRTLLVVAPASSFASKTGEIFMKKALALSVLLLIICWMAVADCPTTSICPEDGMNGNPTGQYKWQGAIEYAQFSHPLSNGGRHVWWERCN